MRERVRRLVLARKQGNQDRIWWPLSSISGRIPVASPVATWETHFPTRPRAGHHHRRRQITQRHAGCWEESGRSWTGQWSHLQQLLDIFMYLILCRNLRFTADCCTIARLMAAIGSKVFKALPLLRALGVPSILCGLWCLLFCTDSGKNKEEQIALAMCLILEGSFVTM